MSGKRAHNTIATGREQLQRQRITPQVPHSIASRGSNSATGSAEPGGKIVPFPSRSATVDLARVLAILFMILGHTLDVLLAATYREGAVFSSWLFLRGLTAPTFLLLSGFCFAVSTARHSTSNRRPSGTFWRRLGRFAFFIALGYAMHLPGRTIQAFRMLDDEGWQRWFQVDVLQCIGVTLIFLQVTAVVSKTPRRFAITTFVVAVFIVGAAPSIWTANWSAYVPPSIAAYLSGHTGSLFPVFPWAGYAFLGAAAGAAWVDYQESGVPVLRRAWPLLGLILILAGLFLEYGPTNLHGATGLWAASPNLFLIRLGCVVLVLRVVGHIVKLFRVPTFPVRSLAQESLTVYFLHVCILYGSVWNPGFRQWIGSTQSPLAAVGWGLVLVVSMMGLALAWNKAKQSMRPFLLRPHPGTGSDGRGF